MAIPFKNVIHYRGREFVVQVIESLDHTLAPSDEGKILVFTGSSQINVTIPNYSSSFLAKGYTVILVQAGTSQVVIQGPTTDSLVTIATSSLATLGPGHSVSLFKGTDTSWVAERLEESLTQQTLDLYYDQQFQAHLDLPNPHPQYKKDYGDVFTFVGNEVLVPDHHRGLLVSDSASSVTLTIQDTDTFDVGFHFTMKRRGTGSFTLIGAGAVQVLGVDGDSDYGVREPNQDVVVEHISPNVWAVSGLTTP